MGASNLGLIFGPTLTSSSGGGAVDDLVDMGLQCRIIETLLANYGAIFDIDEEDEEEEEGDGAMHYEHQQHHQLHDGVVPEMHGEEDRYYGSQMMDGDQVEYHHHQPQQHHQGAYHQGYDSLGYTSYPSRHRQSVYGQIQEEEDDEEEDELGEANQFLGELKSRVPGSRSDIDLVP
ncbi:hypothetical protein BG003_002433 [Podila horticola]|nr:hypothetical protein BG003_002433 [Podila horticola]